MHWYTSVLKKYAVFSGRARRKEYWMFVLFNILIAIAIAFVEAILGGISGTDQSILSVIYSLAVLLPSLGVATRRLHDTGRTGWWLLLGFIPIIGSIVVIVFLCKDSEPGTNAYGPNPKGAEASI
ncbi:MAG: DUF805 domain-containing protein [Elainellaceae cyanobacterium]